ncbi:facilitated trehalose transporter Tret1-like [Palaemon carinicauda]|uniref:facilitated trehalose transporter Tret1-like n=1 Tax=Palaemon carinicauda TaxID=392227 RepID=UPI0035B612B2
MASFKAWFIYRWRQIITSCIIAVSILCTGNVVGWSVEVSRIMEGESITLNITQNDQQWLVSSSGIAAMFSTLFSGALVEYAGPCRVCSFLLLPAALGWVMMAVSESLPWIYIGRIITGGVGFMLTTIIQPLLAEMCTADVRGLLSSLPEIMVSVGMLLIYILARFLDWESATLVCGVILFPINAALLFVPESPYWLLKNGKEKLALRALMKLRAPEHDVDTELSSIRDALHAQEQNGSIMKQVKALKEPGNYRPVLLVTSMFILRELGGAMVIFMYAVFFFENAGVMFDPFTCSVLVGICRLVFTVISACTIDKLGRRPLLIGSSLICGLSMYVTGAVLYTDGKGYGWVPLTSVMVYVASFGMGAGPVPWILLGELLPTPVRSLGASICTGCFVILLFLITQIFPDLTTAIGLEDAVMVFGSVYIILALVAFFFLPESRGRTLEELQYAFVGGGALTPFTNPERQGYTPAYGSTFPSTSQTLEKVR